MKKICSIIALLLSCILLAACAGQRDSEESTGRSTQAGADGLYAVNGQEEYYEIITKREAIFQWGQEDEESLLTGKRDRFIGMQFYQGEPVQLWSVRVFRGIDIVWDIYVYRQDGSREVLLQAIEPKPGYHGYLDQEGSLYLWYYSGVSESPDGAAVKTETTLKKYGPTGEAVFERRLGPEEDILELRQTADGRMYLTIYSKETKERWLAGLDPVNGLITKLCSGQSIAEPLDNLYLGICGNNTAVMTGSGFFEVNAAEGTKSPRLSFSETTYTRPMDNNTRYIPQDFRISEDGSVEILWASSRGNESIRENLRKEKVDKTPVILRTWITGSWLARQVNSFNQSNKTYVVIVESQAEDREDLARLTSVQIASGHGPDIILGDLMQEYIPGMLEKGALEDLSPYLEKSGIRVEDYFPFTFSAWRDGGRIYGISPESPGLAGYRIDSTVLGSLEEPDIETLVNVLLSRQEDAVFLKGYDSKELLEVLLKGTDTLWGMVDWEKGSCDFSRELFAEILETAKRYGDNGSNEEKVCLAESRRFGDIFHFDELAERTRDGKVICGVLFDDGCHVAVTPRTTLAINSNSANKEGAWEFISFLLGDQAQAGSISCPAGRKAFDIWVENDRAEVADGRELTEMHGTLLPDGSWNLTGKTVFSEKDITDEIVEEFKETLEDARPCPVRTVPILNIIREEAADYFNGSKSAAEVGKVVTNRVQPYLEEGR